jgi:metallo-beta-lactamase class B
VSTPLFPCFRLIAASCLVASLSLTRTFGATAADPTGPPGAVEKDSPRAYNAAKKMFDSWKAPTPPRKLIGNIHYVGAIGVSSYLITTPEGHILIDTGFEDTVPIIQKGVEQLGFRLSDIKVLLSSHAHVDHVGGHARMKRLTGARVDASAADARVLKSGGADDFIPLPKDLILYEPVETDRVINEGDTVSLGGITLTAHLTPGHTRGATTWTMDVREHDRVFHVVFFSGTTINEGTKLLNNSAYPSIVEDYTATFAKLKMLPCDIFFAPHGGQFAMAEKFARLDRGDLPNPLIDPEGWRVSVERSEKAFLTELKKETAQQR